MRRISVSCARSLFRYGQCFVWKVIVFVLVNVLCKLRSMFCSSQCFMHRSVFRAEGMGCMGMALWRVYVSQNLVKQEK